MKTLLFILLLAVGVTFPRWQTEERGTQISQINAFGKPVAFCGAPGEELRDSLPDAKLLPGLGDLSHPITTKSPLAQRFFNQGLSFIYAFNHAEAVRSFEKAIQLDPACAMAYWGIAHAYGPNINMPMTSEAEKLAFAAIQKAQQFIPTVSKKEGAYIRALSLRFPQQPEAQVRADSAYISAMKELSEEYPMDPDAKTLYADALMNTFPWQYWEEGGKFKPRAIEVLGVLETVIKANPKHTGAHHLLVHLVEGSNQPARGLKSAAALETLMPQAGHIVHMPSHIYIRTGRFDQAAERNVKAIAVDEQLYGATLPANAYAMYYGHNLHFLYFTANMLGREQVSLETARKLSAKIPRDQLESNPYAQEFSNVTYYAKVRFGRWDEMLALPDPGEKLPYMQSMWHFGRGLAYLRKGEMKKALETSSKLDSLSKLEKFKTFYAALDPVSKTVTIANYVLRGEVRLANKEPEKGLADLRRAIKLEDQLIYNEPPTWPIPVRQFLGAALLAQGENPQAEQIFREDLDRHPENGWSLYGLRQALHNQGRKDEAAIVGQKFDKAWQSADITLASSRF